MSHQVLSFADASKSDPPLARNDDGVAESDRAGDEFTRVGLALTDVQTVVMQIGLGAAVWFLAVIWLYFAWGRHVDLRLAVAAGFFVMFFTLFLLVASAAVHDPRRPQRREPAHRSSLSEP